MKRGKEKQPNRMGESSGTGGGAGRWRGLLRMPMAGAFVALAVAAVVGLLLFANQGWGGTPGPKTAAIIDQLSLSVPNPNFAASATSLLEGAGYQVDYYPGEEVTVDFYRDLPTLDYDLIILRAHAGLSREVNMDTGEISDTEYVSLFTGELYSKDRHVDEQRKAQVGWSVMNDGGPMYFGIGDKFVQEKMKGRFNDTIIVMMGCDGLSTRRTAQTFLDKGAKAFVSWSQPVSASHTDSSTQRLLENILVEGLSVGDAVAQTAAEVGPDPWFGGELRILQSQG